MEIVPQEAVKGKFRVPDGWLTVGVVVLASLASFGLGMLAEREVGDQGPIRIEGVPASALPAAAGSSAASYVAPAPKAAVTAAKPATAAPTPAPKTSGVYVASKNGERYYFPTCSSAKRIKEENKVWFDTKEEAEAAGFTPGANCPGL